MYEHAANAPSDVDAMGKEKRREVVGRSYGPGKVRQLTLYGIAVAIVVALGIGGKLLIDSSDKFPSGKVAHTAPWAQPHVKQHPPKPLQ